MKQLFSFVLLLGSLVYHSADCFAQESYMIWPIEEVSVYESGARIVRSGSVQLNEEGRVNCVVGALTKSIIPNMLQVKLAEDWSLVSSLHRESMARGVKSDVGVALKELDRELKSNRETYAMRTALKQAYGEELAMIQANRKVSGNELLLVEDLVEHADFWRKRVTELNYLMLELQLEMEELENEKEEINGQIRDWNEKKKKREGQFVLQLSGPPLAQANVTIMYVARDASWSTVYDASVDASGSIGVQRFARVKQSTGNDWEDVPLTFTVGRPIQSLAAPVVSPHTLSIARSQSTNAYEWAPAMEASEDEPEQKFLAQAGERDTRLPASSSLARYDFKPNELVFVAGTGVPERIYIDAFPLNGRLTYLAIPAFSDEAYQLVSADAWAQQKMLPGAMNISTNGMHRGSFQLELPAPGDTLRLPLGQDPQVRCSRERLIDLCSSSVFGGSRKTTQSFELAIENQHDRPIDVVIEDRIPMTNSSDIEVEVLELSGGEVDPVSGKVTWNKALAPFETKTIVFSYTVSFPKGHALRGL